MLAIKDAMIASKDKSFQLMEETMNKAFASKDKAVQLAEEAMKDAIASKDKAVQLVEEAMNKAIASKNDAIASKDESLKLAGGIIAKLNTELLVAKGLVEPRCVYHVNSFV